MTVIEHHVERTVVHTPARMSAVASLAPYLHALLRIGAGLLFMQHGMMKLFGSFGGLGGTPGAHAELMTKMGLAGVLEFGGGLLIVLGLFTRPVAFLLAGEMLVAYLQAHMPQGAVPIKNGGELALLFMLVFAFLFGAGAGPLSVDSAIGRRGPG